MNLQLRIMFRWLYLFLFLGCSVYSQKYQEVDRKVSHYPAFRSLQDLGIRIQNDFDSDAERVRAAFIWLTHNISYGYPSEGGQADFTRIRYKSETEKNEAIQDLVGNKINKAFRQRTGVCIDYSLMLHALCEQFSLPSKVVTGIAKTEIKTVAGEEEFINHSWNAVQLNGQWRLMDATWAAGHVDQGSKRFVRSFVDHYFFTEPEDFVRHHLPANKEWQLLREPLNARTFFHAPIYLPDYFEKGIALSSRTKGILKVSRDGENHIFFDQLPEDHLMHYTINGNGEFRRMGFRKGLDNSYTSVIRLRKRFNRRYNYLTVFMNEEPILNFKLEEVPD